MHKEEIREKLEDLREELEETQEEYEEVTSEIDDLTWDLNNLENEQYRLQNKEIKIEKEIQKLEKQLMDKEFQELDNTLTRDEFRDAFIKCSWFSRKYERKIDPLTYVRIEEERLLATDGYRAIIVKCENIPEDIKNTFIKWDIRDNFKDNAKTENWKIIDLEKVIKEGKSSIEIKLREDKFLEKLHYRNMELNGEITILRFNDEKVAFNRKYLDILLETFKGMDMTVYYPRSKRSPMLIENEKQIAILLPIELNSENY